MNREPIQGAALFYMWRLEGIRARCNDLGYCIAVHGSLNYDLDLIAVPWVEDAVDVRTLIQAICDFIGGACSNMDHPSCTKPHGRLAYTITFGGGPHIDLSVMPRQPNQDSNNEPEHQTA